MSVLFLGYKQVLMLNLLWSLVDCFHSFHWPHNSASAPDSRIISFCTVVLWRVSDTRRFGSWERWRIGEIHTAGEIISTGAPTCHWGMIKNACCLTYCSFVFSVPSFRPFKPAKSRANVWFHTCAASRKTILAQRKVRRSDAWCEDVNTWVIPFLLSTISSSWSHCSGGLVESAATVGNQSDALTTYKTTIRSKTWGQCRVPQFTGHARSGLREEVGEKPRRTQEPMRASTRVAATLTTAPPNSPAPFTYNMLPRQTIYCYQSLARIPHK